ncbi:MULTISPECIES: penicillin-binding transpeptidase domain-containing protein [unclassified Corynebacterium]|uniref:penicillin-binding transpeptidase domain-containing protein n=1 Tax=unclassified Corynebacterium TaxID=2624378 RepID=UPI0008A4B03B|nr:MULTISPECIES: penicillin-binding transpeptidase domain-containing protein [unclassified Corynebacterium]MDK8243718.1 penicillin-binding transpeptidase domain-containing protein [Corynebacterium sp. UMB10321]OFT29014.1 cell division protein FtsI [Corynebacterium sp. HMSC08D02]
MQRLLALLLSVVFTGALATACTPRPNDVEPVAREFLDALVSLDGSNFQDLVDVPSDANASFQETVEGLQAEALEATINDVNQSDNLATVSYHLKWGLPKERTVEYDSHMTLTQIGEKWTVRWQPSILHPRLGAQQHLELRPVAASKASVVSSDGVELLRPGTAFRILVEKHAVRDIPDTARRISSFLQDARGKSPAVADIPADELEQNLAQAQGTYSVAMVPAEFGDAAKAAFSSVPGVRINEEAAMVNIEPDFAPDMLARVGELVREDLIGDDGWSVSVVNEHGAVLEDVERHAPAPAPAIEVSLDHSVQLAAERALESYAGRQAMIVAIRPSDGAVLAVAQTRDADREGNLATMGQYPPGSTFKIITAAAGLERQALTPGSTVPCPGTMNLYGRTVTNYAGFSLGNVSLQSAFAHSCNTTFADISTKLAPGELRDIGKQFGLGLDMKIPGLETITGSIPVGEEPLDRTEAGYGQGHDLASPFGMALVAASAANGSMPIPYLIKGAETELSESAPRMPDEAWHQLQEMMAAVTAPGGTAAGMTAGGDIRGKTGEAEINQGSHSWFTGYRVDDDIAFAALVVLGGGSEAAVALTNSMLVNLDQSRGG